MRYITLLLILYHTLLCHAKIYQNILRNSILSWDKSNYTFYYSRGNEAGTTLSILGQKGNKTNPMIIFVDKHNNVLYTFHPTYEDKKGFYRVTFTTEEGGYRTFVNGEEYEFHRTVSKNASRVIITYGLVKYMYAHDEPLWAIKSYSLITHDYGRGEEVPKLINVTEKGVNVDTFVVITGQLISNDSPVNIQILAKDIAVAQLTFKYEDKPFLTLKSVDHGRDKDPVQYTRAISFANMRFTIALTYCYFGWEIYVNGEPYATYYKRYGGGGIRAIKMFGKNDRDGGWRLVRLIWRQT